MAEVPWLSIKVELVSGHGEELEPQPGRVMIVAPSHTLAELAEAIDVAFGRWDLGHLHEFELPDGRRAMPDGDEADADVLDSRATPIALIGLVPGMRFEYLFDLGDEWRHRCEVTATDLDVEEDNRPDRPVPIDGWGWLPDQYGRTTEDE